MNSPIQYRRMVTTMPACVSNGERLTTLYYSLTVTKALPARVNTVHTFYIATAIIKGYVSFAMTLYYQDYFRF